MLPLSDPAIYGHLAGDQTIGRYTFSGTTNVSCDRSL
jgi:hypothetical protein